MNANQETGSMIPANKDPNILIKKTDERYYHVKLQRRSVNPAEPTRPGIMETIQVFSVDEFKVLEAHQYSKQPLVWFHAAGFSEAIVVHDPTLLPPEEKADVIRDDNEAKQKQKERMAEDKAKRMANLEIARAAKAAKAGK